MRYKAPTIVLRCHECNKEFTRKVCVQKSVIKNGATIFFCNRICSGRYKIKHCYKNRLKWKKTGTKVNALSPFRTAIKKCNARKRWEVNIDAQYIKELWDQQRGRCALSGIEMLPLPQKLSKTWCNGPRHPFKPSLDRIDSSKGYIKGNVQWVCVIVNLAKADFPTEYLLQMSAAIVAHNSGRDITLSSSDNQAVTGETLKPLGDIPYGQEDQNVISYRP